MKNHECDIMIGISTRQNTTNLVPFIQFDGQKMILLETDMAGDKNWSKGICDVIEKRGKSFGVCSIGAGDDIKQIIKDIEKLTRDLPCSICWNIGGGQKIQTMSLISVFNNRVKSGSNDWVCYAEPQSRNTTIVCYKDGTLQSNGIATQCFLDLHEIAASFNYNVKKKRLRLLWERKQNGSCRLFKENILSRSDTDWFFNFEKRQEMFLYALQQDRKEPTKPSSEVFPDGSENFGKYFEKVVQSLSARIVAADPASHCLNQVWANVNVVSESKKDTGQEFDVMLVTDFGTLIPIDAKTYDFAKKDEDARKLNLDMISGRYANFWSVFPYMKRDLEDDSILQKNSEWRKLLGRPFELDKRDSKFMVVSEIENESFYIQQGKNTKVRLKNGNSKKSLELKNLTTLIDSINLKKY